MTNYVVNQNILNVKRDQVGIYRRIYKYVYVLWHVDLTQVMLHLHVSEMFWSGTIPSKRKVYSC